ncbi:MAG: glutamate--tRNA ligase family protein, partial [Proteobacteria bacterium]|nr:glutamate--tRNA ligase family protein [Pseudomonadota bacterium]
MRQGLSKPLIARVLGGAPKWTIAELEQKFPPRDLPDGAMVTRFAPSPTGYYHLGNLYQNVIAENLAHCAGDGRARGVFYMRIEDTDTKREVAGAVDTLVSSMAKFGFKLDEGMIAENTEVGEYGPYTQSARKDIYHAIAAELLATGRAYPCFLTSEEMEDIRKKQSLDGLPTGIYGEWARDRDLTGEEITAKLDAGKIPSIRLYSTGDPSRKIYCKDAMRGSIEFPENNSDEIIIKSNDRLPTYHFAHLVDDHFMRTTHVVRAIEWLPSLPLHVQMFTMMGWELPVYIHHATVDILDAETGNRRKISKRKDRVAAFKNLWADGWAPEVFLEYIFNLIVSGYEEAKIKNPSLTVWDYPIKIKKLPVSGALLDMKKMEWWAREFIATLDESNYEIT